MEYLAYLGTVVEAVTSLRPSSVLDVGCGDGRLLAELVGAVPRVVGVDLDERAVAHAAAFAPGAQVEVAPVASLAGHFDVVTCIETLEHVPDDEVADFVQATGQRVRTGGHLVVTVPSTSRPLLAKHHRHYDATLLQRHLAALPGTWRTLRMEETVPHRPWLDHVLRLVSNRWWTFDLPRLNDAILARHRHPVASGRRGLHVVAVLERVT
jgi:2-polyprenyl-3-methyl-5-hydroxy-6-metoxy-1,4-benzoquinol methylase